MESNELANVQIFLTWINWLTFFGKGFFFNFPRFFFGNLFKSEASPKIQCLVTVNHRAFSGRVSYQSKQAVFFFLFVKIDGNTLQFQFQFHRKFECKFRRVCMQKTIFNYCGAPPFVYGLSYHYCNLFR